MRLFSDIRGFEWDKGNKDKNWVKHRVSNEECEEIFFDPHKRLLDTEKYFGLERRCLLIGKTSLGRALFVVFVIREKRVRIISARDLNRRERRLYEKGNQASKV